MHGDYPRSSFDPDKHYTSVRWQQGRVQMDADFNELADILHDRVTEQFKDLIGASGAPEHGGGFLLERKEDGQLSVTPGRMYVGGILCQNDEGRAPLPLEDDNGQPLPAGKYLAYLDVWEREVTQLEDPLLADPALEGADTAVRMKTAWKIRFKPLPAIAQEDDEIRKHAEASFQGLAANRPLLRPSIESQHLDFENQLYRIEVHRPGGAEATFKWSRNNASEACLGRLDGNTVTVDRWTHGARAQFQDHDWVECKDIDSLEAEGPGILVQVAEVTDDALSLDPKNLNPEDQERLNSLQEKKLSVVRWDGVGNSAQAPGIRIDEDSPAEIENGLKVQFKIPDRSLLLTRDYWLIATRHGSQPLLWPPDNGGEGKEQSYADKPPHGIRHHYAPLAHFEVGEDGVREESIADLRLQFASSTEGVVRKTGDVMTGKLTIEDDLQVTGNVGIGTTDPGSSKLKIANSVTDYVDVRYLQSGAGQLQLGAWVRGWNISAMGEDIPDSQKQADDYKHKHLYLNRDAPSTSNVLIGCSGKEMSVSGSDGNVGIFGDLTVEKGLQVKNGLAVGTNSANIVRIAAGRIPFFTGNQAAGSGFEWYRDPPDPDMNRSGLAVNIRVRLPSFGSNTILNVLGHDLERFRGPFLGSVRGDFFFSLGAGVSERVSNISSVSFIAMEVSGEVRKTSKNVFETEWKP